MNAAVTPPPLAADIPSREGWVAVPGARLKYRLCGRPSTLPLFVFENGWGASHHYWAWTERLLAPQTQLLFYDRAGIGESSKAVPQTAEAISQQLEALLEVLGHRQPVLLIGHSYGGLMASLHAAQRPRMLRALVQLDPTPDANDPVIDQQLGWVAQIGRLARFCARLGIPDPVFCGTAKHLPQPEARLIVERAFNSVSSLTGGLEELALLSAIRARIASQASTVPRLLLSADAATEMKGLGRLLASPAKARQLLDGIQALHRQQAQGPQRVFEKIAQTHGGMVFTHEGSEAAAARIMQYARSL